MPDHELLVATQLAETLAERGIPAGTAEEIVRNRDWCHQDYAQFGLGSLDWLAIAVKVEAATGAELPDHVLLEPEHRSVSGWAAALASVLPTTLVDSEPRRSE
ncbi:MAG TPA: phosphopantetheine-binding protein [Amycolatopsis sp.]|uniref:Phosphopantetheine-binding protein n=1 Tax=Amycolatopsis nalaikhensis TaxID=715472 RepID=A0ABY8Y0B9_9PSEU|nr:phosphopantetheine-binding protein [Amycolatopsis sp. 2-2]WIV61045.1 phosphopantetheine-binding protein [Amycolatopsis sp. 2-2]